MPYPKIIFLADDDYDDIVIFKLALQEIFPECKLIALSDPQKFIDNPTDSLDELPNIFIVDKYMPKIDGYELISHIRANPLYNSIPIAIITSCTKQDSRSEALDRGADHYIQKPDCFTTFKNDIILLFTKL